MPDGRLDGDTLYLVTTQVFSQKLHRDLPPTTLWGYNAQYPGPTFEARRGQPIGVRWMNNCRTTTCSRSTTRSTASRESRRCGRSCICTGTRCSRRATAIPKRGSRTTSSGPGRSSSYGRIAIRTTRRRRSSGTTIPRSARLNNYAALSGVYLLRDRVEDGLNLPDGPFEIPPVIQDRFFNPDGSLTGSPSR
jgi:spore coat protein A, manganese oxidase